MVKKLTTVVLASILLAGCAQFAEMEAAREAGSVYLTGRFDEQICELETMAAKSPELGYSTARIVQEVIPQRGSGTSWILRTKYTPLQAKIRLYGSKVEYPTKKEDIDAWIKTVDDNIAKLKNKFREAEEEARRKEEERIAKEKVAAEEARRKEEERIAKEKAAAEEARRKEEERIAKEKAAAEEARRKEEERIAKEKAAAEEARRKEEERIAEAAKIVSEMPESEKFPLLSVQPKPQVLMKNIHSGVTKKWVDAWLIVNKIEHNEDSEFLDERLEDLIIKACFRNENGDVVRQIDFGFRNNVLLNLTINLDGSTATSLDAVVEKYSHDLGPSVNIERKEGESVVRIMTDDVCVCAGDDSFVGRKFAVGKRLAKGALSKIGKNIAALNQSIGNNDQRITDINQGISNIGVRPTH